MSRTSGPVRRFVTQVLALPVAVVVAVGALVVGGAGVASVVAVSDGTGPTAGSSADTGNHATTHGAQAKQHAPKPHGPKATPPGLEKAKAHRGDTAATSANPGLGHGCGHSAGKARGHGVGLAHAPGQQPATCQAPGRLAGHGKPDKAEKARSDKGGTARERAHAKADKARDKGERD